MPRLSNAKKAEANKRLWERANGAKRLKWQVNQQKARDFYFNDQLTKKEKEDLDAGGMPSFIINRITPVIEIMKYFVTAKDPRWQAVGAEGSDADVAAVHSDIADYCWNLSGGRSLFSNVVQDSLTRSLGYFMLDVDADMDRGMGEVVFKTIDPFSVYIDPMSRDFLFRDASYIAIKKDMPKSQLYQLLPDFKQKIKKASGSSILGNAYSQRDVDESVSIQPDDIGDEGYLTDGSEDEIIDYYEIYSKEKVPFMNLFIRVPQSNEEAKLIKEEFAKEINQVKSEIKVALKERTQQIQQAEEQGAIIPERAQLEIRKAKREAEQGIRQQEERLQIKIKELSETVKNRVVTENEFKALMENDTFKMSLMDAIKFYDTRIKVTVSLGGDTFLYEHVMPIANYPIVPIPYIYSGTPYPMSAVSPLIGKQQELNKAHQIMLHNANLASNLRWQYEEGSIPEEDWEQYSSSPGALLKYRQGFNAPTPISPAPINNAFFTVVQQGKADMEYMSGIYATSQGDTGQQHDTYRGMLAIDEHGTRRIKAWMQTIVEPALEHLGKVFKELAQKTYTANKVFRIVQPTGLQTEKEVEINIPIYDDYGKAVSKWNDYASSKFDVKVVGGSTMPVNRWALLEEYFRWYQSGLIDDIAMLAQTDIRGKEQIIKRKSVYAQLKQQINSLEEEVKEVDGENETLKRQLVQAGIKHGVDVGSAEIDKEVNLTKAQQKLLRQIMQGEHSLAKKDLGRKVDTAVAQFKAGLKTEK